MIDRSLKKACARATIAATGAAIIVMASLAFYQLDRWTLPRAATIALMTMIIAFPVAGMGILGIGLPVHWLLRRLGRVSIGYYVAIAAIVSLVLARWFVGRDVFSANPLTVNSPTKHSTKRWPRRYRLPALLPPWSSG